MAIANAQATMVVPIWNRNQGGIRRAEGELAAARADYRRVELSLQQRLAGAFQTYGTARYSVKQYEDEILPAAGESLELVRIGYRQGELNYLRLLTAQRTFFTTRLAYLDALSQMHQTLAQIDSFLLSGSLNTAGQAPTLNTSNNKSLGGY
jgi:cobalt-zinc-cadmium efflux system outer membrane protein